jgi:hypothetical protein
VVLIESIETTTETWRIVIVLIISIWIYNQMISINCGLSLIMTEAASFLASQQNGPFRTNFFEGMYDIFLIYFCENMFRAAPSPPQSVEISCMQWDPAGGRLAIVVEGESMKLFRPSLGSIISPLSFQYNNPSLPFSNSPLRSVVGFTCRVSVLFPLIFV